MSTPASLRVDIFKRYLSRRTPELERHFELRVEAEIPPGITMLFGHSGSGKTTLLNCIAGLAEPDGGTISLDREHWFHHENGINLSPRQRQIGYQMQDLALFPHMTAERNIRYGLVGESEKQQQVRMTQANLAFKVGELLDKYPREMSGGEQQRVALARALVRLPKVLLLDEPTSALDPISTSSIEVLLQELKKNYTLIVVTHNMQQAARVSDKTAFFYLGELIEYDDTKSMFTNPQDKRTQNYITGRFS